MSTRTEHDTMGNVEAATISKSAAKPCRSR